MKISALFLTTMILAAAALPGSMHAQEATADAPAEEPDRWGAEIGFSLNSSGGNESLTILTTELGLTHLEKRSYELAFKGRLRYGRSEGVDVAQNLRGGLNFDLWPQAGWSPFLFVTAEQDPFRKLEARANGGSGVKRTFWQNGWDEVSLSGAVLYSFENLEIADSLGDGITRTALWSWRARARRQIREGTRFEQVVFYQPAWDDAGDYMIEAQTSGRVALTRTVAFTGSFLYERDSTPAPDVEPDDWSLSLGLSMATAW